MTIVHIAAEPGTQTQGCTRCAEILIDVRRAMVPAGQPSVGCWGPGCYVGVIPGNPQQSFVMDHDAEGSDEIPCNRRVQ